MKGFPVWCDTLHKTYLGCNKKTILLLLHCWCGPSLLLPYEKEALQNVAGLNNSSPSGPENVKCQGDLGVTVQLCLHWIFCIWTLRTLWPRLWCPAGPKVSPGCPCWCGSRWVRKLWTSLASEVAFPFRLGLKILWLFWEQWPLGDHDEDWKEATFPALISYFFIPLILYFALFLWTCFTIYVFSLKCTISIQ